MRGVAKRVDDPEVERAQSLKARCRNPAEVAGISEPCEPESQRINVAVLLQERQHRDRSTLPGHRDRHSSGQTVLGDDRGVAASRRRLEAIGEPAAHHRGGALVKVNIDALAPLDEQRAQIVDAVGVVGVFVRVEHAVEPIDVGVEELLAQIRRGVDEDAGNAVGRAPLDQ